MTEDLETAIEEADQINQTFEALLRIAQIESRARKAHFSDVDLGAVLCSISEIYVEVAVDSKQTLVSAVDQNHAIIVRGDHELLTQMYVNLVENAIRHCPEGTRILLKVRSDGDRIVTSIEDNGPGIPQAEHERIFRRLYRLERSRTSPGTGLGLSLVKAVADLHDAEISVENAKPGLRFLIAFAAAPSEKP